jgi:serine/threonine protein kinase
MQPQPEPSPGAPVSFGRYQLIRRIGAGGMGEVFLAREPGPPARACVIKKVLPHLAENRAFVGRFLDEAKVVVRLKHPNVARVYAMGDVEGEYFLAMEYVQGKTISRFARRLRERKQSMSLGHILLLGEKVCQGLAYAHDANDSNGAPLHLVHRDLSPANVCISYRGEVKIIDFGAAQSTLKEAQTAPRVVIGNLTYMAPEQAKKQFVDRRADVYSCGVMLWELLAWHVLPQKGDPVERWRRAAYPSWDPPSMFRSNVPREVDDALLRALDKNPDARYRDAAVFGAELYRLRKKISPEADDSTLGLLLTKLFDDEKGAEDEILNGIVQGVAVVDDEPTHKSRRPFLAPPTAIAFEHRAVDAPEDFNAEKLGPMPKDEITDPSGDPTRRPTVNLRRPTGFEERVSPTRVGFGVSLKPTLVEQEVSIIEEIEAIDAAVDAEEAADDEPEVTPDARPTPLERPRRAGMTRQLEPSGPQPTFRGGPPFDEDVEEPAEDSGLVRWVILCTAVFLIATALGFLGMYGLLQRQ